MIKRVVPFVFWMVLMVGVVAVARFRQIQIGSEPLFPLTPTLAFQKSVVASIRLRGAGETYRRLKEQLATVDYLRYHSAGHVFGATLYKTLGNRGFGLCDQTLVFGCFHGFSIVAIKYRGTKALDELTAVCRKHTGKLRGSCLHGMGHGLGEYYGPDRLDEQFVQCERIEAGNTEKGCIGGAIMQYFEYYNAASMGPPSVDLVFRPFDETKPYGPCPGLRPRYQKVCFFNLPPWWWSAYSSDVSVIERLCTGVAPGVYRDACFNGFGAWVAQMTKDTVEEIIRICSKLTERTSQLLCRNGAAGEASRPESPGKGSLVCAGLSPVEEQFCREGRI